MVIFAACGMAFLAIMCSVADWIVPANGEAFVLAVIVSAVIYFIYLIGVNSVVRMDGNGVTVDNVIVRHVIPWSKLLEIGVKDGLYFRLDGGTVIKSTSYAGSLGATLTNYRYTKGVAARMQAVREQLATGGRQPEASASYSIRVRVAAWPPLTILASLEAIALLSQVAR